MSKIADIEALIASGLWEEACLAAERLVQAQPAIPRAHYLHGICLAHQGRQAEASESFGRAFALDPRFWQAGAALARSLDCQGRYEEALEAAEQVSKERPSDQEILGLVRGLRRQVPERDLEGWQVSLKQSWWMIDLKGPEDDE